MRFYTLPVFCNSHLLLPCVYYTKKALIALSFLCHHEGGEGSLVELRSSFFSFDKLRIRMTTLRSYSTTSPSTGSSDFLPFAFLSFFSPFAVSGPAESVVCWESPACCPSV